MLCLGILVLLERCSSIFKKIFYPGEIAVCFFNTLFCLLNLRIHLSKIKRRQQLTFVHMITFFYINL